MTSDLQDVLNRTPAVWKELANARLFITGGTGFFGRWLLESLTHAIEAQGLKTQATILTRDPDAFKRSYPRLGQNPAFTFHAGSVTDFRFPEGSFSHVIHAATPASAKLIAEDPEGMYRTIVEGTKRVLEFARTHGTRKLLLTSSGAVYGRQPSELTHLREDSPFSSEGRNAYCDGKRLAESLCLEAGLQATIARCFAFVGPHLPLDAHYAIGNFIGDGLAGRPIRVQGDGTPRRSYLYAGDLTVWLWRLLCEGQGIYNVGSDQDLSIGELAQKVATSFGVTAEIAQKPDPTRPLARYVPSVNRARTELGLEVWNNLDASIQKTIAWHRKNQ